MSLAGRWRIVVMPDYVEDYPDMMEPAYIEFAANGSGEFAFGCVTGQIFGAGDGNHIAFSWQGNDEMDEVQGGLGRNPTGWLPQWANVWPALFASRIFRFLHSLLQRIRSHGLTAAKMDIRASRASIINTAS